jgi:NADH/NAD ratio-sensing transcriptional regulator Rex
MRPSRRPYGPRQLLSKTTSRTGFGRIGGALHKRRPYEFANELGLKLLDAYPVRRNGQKVYVKPCELTLSEISAIHIAVRRLSVELGKLTLGALKRTEAERQAIELHKLLSIAR